MTPTNAIKTRVLVIDDEPQILRALRINLSVRGYEVDTATNGGQGLGGRGRPPPSPTPRRGGRRGGRSEPSAAPP